MSYHHFYNYSLRTDDADCLNFLLYDYLKASRNTYFRCSTIKDFMYYLLLTSLKENEVLALLFEAIYYLPRLDILHECNISYDDYQAFEFGQYINMKRILLFKLFNAHSEKDFLSFAKKICHNNSDRESSHFQYLEYLFDKWQDDSEMNKSLECLSKYNSVSNIPEIISRYHNYDKSKHVEIKIPVQVETTNIVVALVKGDQSCSPKFLENSQSGLKTIDYDPKTSYPYPEDGNFKSVCIIFNVCKYKSRERRGSHFDVEDIRTTFSKLHFSTQVYEDPTKEEMFEVTNLYSQLESTKAGMMFVCFILAHGEKDNIFDINEEVVNCRQLSMKFSAKNCEAYRGKPKVFFIQACQGDKYQEGFPLSPPALSKESQTFTVPQVEQDGRKESKIKQYKEHTTIPEEADFIFGMSTVPDCVAFRDVKRGSWYIRTLCKEIRKNASKCHLIDILTTVTCKVSQKKYGVKYCQLPAYCSTATKKCYLTSLTNDGDKNNDILS